MITARAFWSIAAWAQLCTATAQNGWAEQRFTSLDGLPQNSVLSMAQDSIGMVWIATEAGLARFGGQVFRRIEPLGGPGHGNDRMRLVMTTADGSLFARASGGGLFAIHAHHLAFPVGTARLGARTSGLVPSIDIYQRAMDADSFPLRDRWRSDPFVLLATDEHHWFAAGEAMLYGYTDLVPVDSIAAPIGARCYMVLAEGIVCVGPDGNVNLLRTGARRFLPVPTSAEVRSHLTDPRIRYHAQPMSRTAVLLAPAGAGLLRFAPGSCAPSIEPLGMRIPPMPSIRSALWMERQRTLLIGTETRGLYAYRENGLELLRSLNPDSSTTTAMKFVHAINDDSLLARSVDGRCWMVASGHLRALPSIGTITSSGICVLGDGSITYGRGDSLMRLDRSLAHASLLVRTLGQVNRSVRDGETLLIAHSKGIDRWAGGKCSMVLDGLPENAREVTAMRVDARGTLWFGTVHGLYRMQEKTGEAMRVPGSEGSSVRALTTLNGIDLVGSYGNGPAVLHDGVLRHLPLDRQRTLLYTHSFTLDSSGYLWMSTNRGLVRTVFAAIERWIADSTVVPGYEWFGGNNGLPGVEFNGGGDPSVVRVNGSAYYPTFDGVAHARLDRVPQPLSPSAIIFERARVDGAPWPIDEYLVLPNGTKELRVPYSFAYWGDPANLVLEYSLEDTAGPWYPMHMDAREVVLADPPLGEHLLRVRATGALGAPVLSDPIWFNIEVPFHRTPAGIATFSLSVLVAFGLLLWWNARRLKRRNAHLEQAVATRTGELSAANHELQRALRLKDRLFSILNHDIVSPLRFITRVARGQLSGGMLGADPEQRAAMQDLSFASEKLYGNAQNLLNWVKQQEGGITLQCRFEVVQLVVEEALDRVRVQAHTQGLKLVNDVPLDDVLKFDKNLLAIVLDNLLSNAVNFTKEGMIRVSSSVIDGTYHLIVMDTGPGFSAGAKAQIDRIASREHGLSGHEVGDGVQGLGYIIIAGMMELMGGDYEVLGSTGTGATVVLNLPVKK